MPGANGIILAMVMMEKCGSLMGYRETLVAEKRSPLCRVPLQSRIDDESTGLRPI